VIFFQSLTDRLPNQGQAVQGSDCYIKIGMKKPEIAKRLARKMGASQGEAADRLDAVVRQIVSKLRRGEEAPLPGLGRFKVGPNGQVNFEREKES
jgi:uncharacterized protein YidB (DUF937 family)